MAVVRTHGLRIQGTEDTASMLRKLASRAHEAYQLRLFSSSLADGMTVVDVGASVGIYALLASRGVGSTGRVYALEPDPRSRTQLLINLERNHAENVQVVAKAAGARGETRTLFLGDQSTVSSLYDDPYKSRIVGITEVGCVTLDVLLERERRVDIIKIDTEGAEQEVLDGLATTLGRPTGPPKLFIEIHPGPLTAIGVDVADVLATLRKHFASVAIIDESTCSLQAPTVDRLRQRCSLLCR